MFQFSGQFQKKYNPYNREYSAQVPNQSCQKCMVVSNRDPAYSRYIAVYHHYTYNSRKSVHIELEENGEVIFRVVSTIEPHFFGCRGKKAFIGHKKISIYCQFDAIVIVNPNCA